MTIKQLEQNRIDQDTKFLLKEIATKAYRYVDAGYRLSAGGTSYHYIDLKTILLDTDTLVVAANLANLGVKAEVAAIAGIELGSIGLATAMAIRSRDAFGYKQCMIVRKKPKNHGTRKCIEAPALEPGANVCIVEDVCTTGTSAANAVMKLQAEGYNVSQAISLVDRDEGANELFSGLGIDYSFVYSLAEIIQFRNESKTGD